MNRAALLGLISLQLVALPARLAADAHYRTIADRASRGLVGQLEELKTPEDSAKLPFFPRAQLATAAAWSPNLCFDAGCR